MGLNHITIDLAPPRKRVGLGGPFRGNGPYGHGNVVYGLGPLIVTQAPRWPDVEGIEAIFARFS